MAKVRRLVATGEATVLLMPDQVQIWAQVHTESKQLPAAQDAAAGKTAAILEAVRRVDARIELDTSQLQVRRVTRNVGKNTGSSNSDGTVRPKRTVAYRVEQQVGVRARGRDLGVIAARLVDALTDHGADTVSDIRFSTADDRPARREALEAATLDAVDNARAMARGLGVDIVGFERAQMHDDAGRFWRAPLLRSDLSFFTMDTIRKRETPPLETELEAVTARAEVVALY